MEALQSLKDCKGVVISPALRRKYISLEMCKSFPSYKILGYQRFLASFHLKH